MVYTKKSLKVAIIIELEYYDPNYKEGRQYTAVGCGTSNYGSAAPCDTKEEIESAIASCKKLILSEKDIPYIIDKRPSGNLLEYFEKSKNELNPKRSKRE